MGTEICFCENCGTKLVTYKHGLNKGLSVVLKKLFEYNGPAKTENLGLSYVQRTNSMKLRYWELATPHIVKETIHKRGWWQITDKGRAFVNGELAIAKFVFIRQNRVVKYEGPYIYFNDIKDGYLYRADYQKQASNQLDENNNQLELIP